MHDDGTTPVRGAEHQAAEDSIQVVPVSDVSEPHGLIWKAVDALLFVGICAMLLSLAAQMVSRQMGASLSWTEELTRFLFMDTTFLGMAAGFRAAVHPRVNFVVAWGPAWLKKVSMHLYAVCGTVFFSVLIYKTWELMLQQYAAGESSPALGLKMFLVTLPLVISAALAIVAHITTVYFSPYMRKRILKGEMIAS
ncbi:TRAP transporter small permease [Arthrobacter nitrophenolicus]|uniref:TRAP transporter small permease n=1 Tax=Arthrobacter nitrophenolicus TaxID=683150 RepID=UPI0014043393|nr:TRAP transporter small permease [Arthrobacter nitrophenolicus]